MTIPRIAVGTIQPGADATRAVWSLLAVLEDDSYQLQEFHYRSDAHPCDGIRRITGQGRRHLDSWLMPKTLCRELFVLGSQGSDLALVDGRYDVASLPLPPSDGFLSLSYPLACRMRGGSGPETSANCLSSPRSATREIAPNPQRTSYSALPSSGSSAGGSLDTLCQWLDLPRIVVIDAELWKRGENLDAPFPVAGILLDRVVDSREGAKLAEQLQRRWRAPVLGLLRETAGAGDVPARKSSNDCSRWSDEFRKLGADLHPTFRANLFWEIAERGAADWEIHSPLPCLGSGQRLRIAVACDDAFQCYFSDTLDVLEACGAELRAFSPLRCPDLPAETDLVFLGCGHIERYAEELSANCCLRQSLHAYAAAGGRIYAEGAGLAYLCRHLVVGSGRRYPMVNVLPALATQVRHQATSEPAVVRFRRSTWLGKAYQELRGYLNPTWQIDSWGANTNLALEAERQGDLFGCRNVIGSRLQLNFAAQPHFLPAFFRPRMPQYAPV